MGDIELAKTDVLVEARERADFVGAWAVGGVGVSGTFALLALIAEWPVVLVTAGVCFVVSLGSLCASVFRWKRADRELSVRGYKNELTGKADSFWGESWQLVEEARGRYVAGLAALGRDVDVLFRDASLAVEKAASDARSVAAVGSELFAGIGEAEVRADARGGEMLARLRDDLLLVEQAGLRVIDYCLSQGGDGAGSISHLDSLMEARSEAMARLDDWTAS